MSWFKTAAATIALLTVLSSTQAAPDARALLQESGIRGGVVVHVGCGDGKLTAELLADDKYLVSGVDADAGNVAKAKAHIDSLGRYGGASAEKYDGRNLPHGDSVVNLFVIESAPDLPAKEVARALVPKGVAMVKGDAMALGAAGLVKAGEADGWTKYTKPWPKALDEWTHYMHDASGNAVSKDREVGHPRRLQWWAGPKHSRHHDALASMSAMTSSDGRMFYIYDEGSISVVHRPPDWKLIARDAFNGKLLWKRDVPTWMTHLYNFRAGPKQLTRRLVSAGEAVYATLGFTAAVTKLDAATGKTLTTYEGSEKTEELIYHEGVLLTVKGDPELLIEKSDQCHGYWELAEHDPPTVVKSIVAYDAAGGKKLWEVTGENVKTIAPLSLCARGDSVFYLDGKQLHCLDAKTGKQRWASPFETEGQFIRSYAPTVVVTDGVIMCLTWNRLHGFSVADGKKLWENKGSIGFGSPGDLFVIGGKAWTNPLARSIWKESKKDADGIVRTGISIPRTEFLAEAKVGVAVDIRTGKIVDEVDFARNQHHHRCYRDKATERYMLLGYSGIQLVDFETKAVATNQWVRGICQYGIMPANGCVYVPPTPCQCYGTVRINGFFALRERNSLDDVESKPALEKGPAYGRISKGPKAGPDGGAAGGWPTYRGNISRSGSTESEVAGLEEKWETDIGQGITPPVVAGNRVFVAQRDAYTVHCLDRKTGKRAWKLLANGPIDSPPTIHAGLCVVGCGDGSVYCLDAETGELAWRFKVSSIERRIGSDNRLESPLSISGSVLVVDDTAYFAAGRSSFLDGGIRIYGLDVRTGEVLHSRVVASGHWDRGGQSDVADVDTTRKHKASPGALVDILISDGEAISMRQVKLTAQLEPGKAANTLYPSTGLLDDTWFHRQDWKYSRMSGQLVVYDDNAAFGVANPYTGLKKRRAKDYKKYKQDGHLHQKFTRYEEEFFPVGSKISGESTAKQAGAEKVSWSVEESFQPRAMVLAGKNLYLAGWVDSMAIQLKTGRADSQGDPDPRDPVLRVYSAASGKRVSEHTLESEPVFDGAAAAYGNLFISLKNGKIVCLGK